MVNTAKSEAEKSRIKRALYEQLVIKAADRYILEHTMSEEELHGRKPRTYREVAADIQAEYEQKSGKRLHQQLSWQTVYDRAKGRKSMLETRSEQALLMGEEAQLVVDYALEIHDRGFPINRCRVAEIANKVIKARVGENFEGVGLTWAARFIQREEKLCMRWTRGLEDTRAKAVNPAAHEAWVDMAHRSLTGVEAHCIFGCDEAGFSTSHGQKSRVVGRAGNRSFAHDQRGGTRDNHTLIATICTDGTAPLPTVVMKGNSFRVEWLQENPIGFS
jgi:hypothetical protein